jgi:hypothetical protein
VPSAANMRGISACNELPAARLLSLKESFYDL